MNNLVSRRLFLIGAASSFLPLIPITARAMQDDEIIGKVVRLQAAAVAMQNAMPRILEVGSEILLGDVISTGPDARILIELSDGGELTLGEKTIFVVLEYVMSMDSNNAVMQLLEGAFLATSGKLMQQADASFEINTPTATIGIRGTTVWGGPLDHELEVVMLAGKGVYVETKQGRVELTEVGGGTSIKSAKSKPTPAKVWGAGKIARASATIAFK